MPLPRELETSRHIINSKKPRLEDIDFAYKDEDDDTGIAAERKLNDDLSIEMKDENTAMDQIIKQPQKGLSEDTSAITTENKSPIGTSNGNEDHSEELTADTNDSTPTPAAPHPASKSEGERVSNNPAEGLNGKLIETDEIGKRMTTRGSTRAMPRQLYS